MASSKKTSNGRSPLVNQQSQITAFFTKKPETVSSSPSPSPNPVLRKQNPHSSSNTSSFQSPSSITTSLLSPKRKKPILVVGTDLSTLYSEKSNSGKKTYGPEVVERRIRVYWPLDKSWYEGCVKSFDKLSGKHLVLYDDSEEELLNLSGENIEWVDGEPAKKLRRLRKISVVEDEEDDTEKFEDDSEDEDWVANVEKAAMEEEDRLDDMDLDEEESGKCDRNKKVYSRKQSGSGSGSGGNKLGSNASKKKSKFSENLKSSNQKVPPAVNGDKLPNPMKDGSADNGISASIPDCSLGGNAADRFAMRNMEKLGFLEKDQRDAKRRRPGDVDYDSRTLYLPPNFVKSLTEGQRQWWEFKSKHMDKVLFFKMGKFYELFEMDAHVGAKELGLQYMKGEQPHCGFPERNFSINVEKLARKGYRVLVVEQTETPEQLELRRKENGCKDKVVKRDICAVVTKGTLTEGEILSTTPDASYLMAVTESCKILANQRGVHIFGVCVVDVATSNIILGQFRDDSDCTSLCSLLSELRPVEIIKPAKLLCPETEKALFRHTRNPLVNELVPFSEFWNAEKTIREATSIYQRIGDRSCIETVNNVVVNSSLNCGDSKCLPEVLSDLVNLGENGSQALSALGGTLFYLRQAFLDETLLRFAKYELLPCSGFGEMIQKPYMVLDAAALENLEIFENSRNGESSGTLYAQLNHCATAFGKRLLRSWLARPLYHLEQIKERQDAIAELKGVGRPYVLDFRKELIRLPDMERLLACIFASSEANGRNAIKVVLYEDASKKQLQEFTSALRGCELMIQSIASFGGNLGNVESRLLYHLFAPGAGIPDISSILRHFKDAFDWEEADNSGRIIPREGADVEYDAACQKLNDIESDLRKHLKEQHKLLGDASISYVTVGKDEYLLEVPESLSDRIPKEYELRSSKKGYFRYWSPVIKKLLGELSQAESEKESKLKSILRRLVERFCENHCKWRQLVSTIAELDVLISLSIASEYYEGKTCRPILSASFANEVPRVSAKSLGHPVLKGDTLGDGIFVTNDITLGGSDNASFILLTGPNMGGKSTLLRQVCLAVILAQIGADVPAESFELSPIDRIFVRMGAKDHIMAGHSTFLTELLETASMLSSATQSSLVALDELGRGTSTSDGQAIAASVLEHFVTTVQCRGMFSTHYHKLAIEHQKNPKVFLCHMACQVGKGITGLEEVIFLYKLRNGTCPRSYGVNVARLAGLPDAVLQRAAKMSTELEAGSHGKNSGVNSPIQSWEDDASLVIQNLSKVAANKNWESLSKTIVVESLINLQNRARLLLKQW
ncbi:DNA mismatch repair protein MSH6 [Primulina huaijiensis]|uniref:DNA mismatch repair protein MSH6 n=1 Tax=Primulina huaijiensis TaxID=1492673 RepID=UPI003CC7630E